MNKVPCEISGEILFGTNIKLLCQAGRGVIGLALAKCSWKLYEKENAMNAHLTNERIVYLFLDYTGSSVWSSK